MTATIVDLLQCGREPADLYELLGELRFEPSRQKLLAAVRTHYARLLPYESHADPDVARRATELLRRLAEADGTLRDLAQLRAHHRAILEDLRAASDRAGAARFSTAELAEWLRQRSVHPQRIPAVARMLAPPQEETQSIAMAATQRLESRTSKDSPEEFCLEELQPQTSEVLKAIPSLDVRGAKGSGVFFHVGGEPRPREEGAHADMEKDSRPLPFEKRPRRRFPQLGWVALIGVGVLGLVGALIAVFSTNEGDLWQGVLLQVRGHADEIHILIQSEGGARVEAITRDARAARVLDDYWSVEELEELQASRGRESFSESASDVSSRGETSPPTRKRTPDPFLAEAAAGASRVAIRGRPVPAKVARFRLDSRANVPLVELKTIGKAGGRRGVSAANRVPARRAELAQFLRIHPPVGTTVSFPARYGGTGAEGVTLFPSASDRRPVPVPFPGTSPRDFANYRSGDSVLVQAIVSDGTIAARLALRGVEIRRLAEPASRVVAKGK